MKRIGNCRIKACIYLALAEPELERPRKSCVPRPFLRNQVVRGASPLGSIRLFPQNPFHRSSGSRMRNAMPETPISRRDSART